MLYWCHRLFIGEVYLVRFLLVLLVILRVTFLGVVYLLAGLSDAITWPQITVNTAFAIDPMRAVAAYILPISGMVLVVVLGLRLRRIRFVLHAPEHWIVWYLLVIHLGMAVFGLFGLAAVTPATNLALAYVFGAFWYAGTIGLVILTVVLNHMVGLVEPAWLRDLRFVLAIVVAISALIVAITIGWVDATSSIAEIILSATVVFFYMTFMHKSDFTMDSYCPFAYPADVPPVPKGVPQHSQLIVRETG